MPAFKAAFCMAVSTSLPVNAAIVPATADRVAMSVTNFSATGSKPSSATVDAISGAIALAIPCPTAPVAPEIMAPSIFP